MTDEHETIAWGPDFAEWLLASVRQASDEILLDARALSFDAFGQLLLSEMEYACRRGLRVHCLLDAEGCREFIEEHPALLTQIDTAFRLRKPSADMPAMALFDREWGVLGAHTLSEQGMRCEGISQLLSEVDSASLANAFDERWSAARPPERLV